MADPESYNFRPREMLRDVVTAFANLSVHEEFLRAVAASSYYESRVFAKAITIQRRIRIVSEVRWTIGPNAGRWVACVLQVQGSHWQGRRTQWPSSNKLASS